MITALIAEDELLVRIGISSCVSWAEMDIHLIGETGNGLEAWKLYQEYKPDIVITDIRMPGLSGVELIKKIRAVNQDCALIIVTNVDDDETLKEIRQYGVSTILLKAEMNKSDISAAVKQACEKLRETDNPFNENTGEDNRWHHILFENSGAMLPFAVKGMIGLRIFPEEKLSHQMQQSLSNLVLSRINGRETYDVVSKGSCLLLLWREEPEKYTSGKGLQDLLRYVQDHFGVKMGIVALFTAVEEHLPNMAQFLIDLLHEPRYFDAAYLWVNANGVYQHERLNKLNKEIVRSMPILYTQEGFINFYDQLKNYPGPLQNGFDWIYRKNEELLHMVGSHDSFGGLNEMTEWICEKTESQIQTSFQKIRPEIRQALDYINNHLSEDLSLEQVCGVVGFHSRYFSRLFKSELRSSYSEYVMNARMLHAQALLKETDLQVSEVAERCGFPDISYFSARFKQFCGQSPRQWREDK